ncbi:MAG: hypothetical protein GY795_33535 [Desulfobacterales bacterium]|nr:hypothetical protein [Desulfobacterales bacterium]
MKFWHTVRPKFHFGLLSYKQKIISEISCKNHAERNYHFIIASLQART